MKRGFTLLELLVVISMLVLLMGALTTSVSQSRKRTQIVKATQDMKEITNAILAYQNFAPNRSLEKQASGSWAPASEGNLGFILGQGEKEGGGQAPVLYNAQLRGGAVCDPWGQPYEFMIKKTPPQNGAEGKTKNFVSFVSAPSLPNFYRLTDEERGSDEGNQDEEKK